MGTPHQKKVAVSFTQLVRCCLRKNEDIVESFLNRSPQFRIAPAADVWQQVGLALRRRALGDISTASPHRTATDGFFACIMERLE